MSDGQPIDVRQKEYYRECSRTSIEVSNMARESSICISGAEETGQSNLTND